MVNTLKDLCFLGGEKKKKEQAELTHLTLFYYSCNYTVNMLLNHGSEITVGVGNQKTDKTVFKPMYQPTLSLSPEVELDNTHC